MSTKKITIVRSKPNARSLIESASVRDLGRLLEEKEARKEIEKSLLAKLRDSEMLDAGLDLLSALGVGLEASGAVETSTGVGALLGVPSMGIGAAISIVADVINAIRMALRGDYYNSALHILFAVPILGDSLQLGADTVKIIKWIATSTNTAKAARAASAAKKLVDIGTEHVPGAEKHREPLSNAITAIASGDPNKAAEVAKQSGHEVLAREIADLSSENSDEKSLSESFKRARAAHSLRPLYKGTLY